MFFVIPEMPSKTFVMLYKKLPDHFKCSSDNNSSVLASDCARFISVAFSMESDPFGGIFVLKEGSTGSPIYERQEEACHIKQPDTERKQ